jgi:hypothetical protein
MIPRDVEEPEDVAAPFALTVSRGTVEERYSDCCWSSHNRLDTQEGLRKVRTVLALKRNVKKLG